MDISSYNLLVSRRNIILYAILFGVGLLFIGRLFYLQVLKHDYYSQVALEEHESKFVLPANRGQIYAFDGQNRTPLVLNEVLPTVYIDPQGIDDEENQNVANQLVEILEVDYDDVYDALIQNDSRYQIIKRETPRNQIRKLEEAGIPGVGFKDESYRVYPQGDIAAQLLGFVNNEGVGQYGIEQFLNDQLAGVDGRLSAVTDVYGIPLSNNEDNIEELPIDGQDVTLTIDLNIQKHAQEALARGVQRAKGKSGSAIVIDPNSGAILAMANYPSYDPGAFSEVEDIGVFNNQVVDRAYETGSGMKVFTMSMALNEGAVTPNTSYYDPGATTIDGIRIENAGASGGVQRTMTEVIQKSVNTGVIYALAQVGGGEINEAARNTFHSYLTKRYGFGSQTGIEQANEASGFIYGPNTLEGNNVRYANMTFGQGLTVTMLQMVSGVSALINGGDYYQPHLIYSQLDDRGNEMVKEPVVLRSDIISDKTSKQIIDMMERVVDFGGGYIANRTGYLIGAKTGTSQVIDPETGEYSDTLEVGTFVGFGGSDRPEYVIMTRVDEPRIEGYAGTVAAAPIFADISNWLIEYFQIPPTAQ